MPASHSTNLNLPLPFISFQLAPVDGDRGDEGPAGSELVRRRPTPDLRRRRFHRPIEGRRSRRADVGSRSRGQVTQQQPCVSRVLGKKPLRNKAVAFRADLGLIS